MLLAPISDWAAEIKLQGKNRLDAVASAAKKLVAVKKPHALLPEGLWHETLDAQRFLSLYSPDSIEEIFSYAQPNKAPRILGSVKIPILVLLAENDEFADRPAKQIADWFEKNIKSGHEIVVIPQVAHGFSGAENGVSRTIRSFIGH